jgi:hypothetical protein
MNGFLSGTVEQMGGNAYKLEYSSMQPYCEQCYVVLNTEELLDAVKNKKPFKCSACGHIMPVREADSSVKGLHPKAVGVVNDAYGVDAGIKAGEKEMVLVFKCMTCGSGLELTQETERTTKCAYCDNDNYLPDSIWTKLHPNKEVQPLFLLLDLGENDIHETINYFLRINALAIYEKHFENFVREYFERPFVSDALLVWLKYFLQAKKEESTGRTLDPQKPQRSFLNNLALGYGSHPEKLKETAAEYSINIPPELQKLMANDKIENVRLALAKNTSIDKDILKILQNDSSPAVAELAGKQKKGFFKSLFS